MKKRKTNIRQIRNKLDKQYDIEKKQMERVFNGITSGIIIDTNDPQEMGRIKVFCPSYGDSAENKIEDLPWCLYGSPLAGITGYGTRGSEDDKVIGPTSYGIWGIPKVGSTALVVCLDGDPNFRIWVGCLYRQYTPHTLPHGRNFYNDEFFERLGKENPIKPEGPLSSSEEPIQPLYKNYDAHFQREAVDGRPKAEHIKDKENHNFEWRTRGADTSVAAIDSLRAIEEVSVSTEAEDQEFKTKYKKGPNDKDYIANNGYDLSRQNPEFEGLSTIKNFDSMDYSWTSPGFHSISMNDKPENCKMRLRTTSGHQILMDDTNQRIYISTAKGNNWIEMDEEGNMEFYTEGNFSVHARKDINMTAGGNIKMYTGNSINLKAENEVRTHAWKDIHVKTDQNYRQYSLQDTFIESNQKIDILALDDIKVHTDATLHLQSDSTMFLESTGNDINILANNNVSMTAGTNIDLFAKKVFSALGNLGVSIFSGLKLKLFSTTSMHFRTLTNMHLTSVISTHVRVFFGNLIETAEEIHHNPGNNAIPADIASQAEEAAAAKKAVEADELYAYGTSKVPEHEPWNRSATKPELLDQDNADNILDKMTGEGRVNEDFLEFDYMHENVQKEERGRKFKRSKHWRR